MTEKIVAARRSKVGITRSTGTMKNRTAGIGVTSFDALCWTRGRGLRKGTDRCGDAVGE
jgi:hypothetical protein